MERAPFCPARKRVDFNPRYVSIDTKCERPRVQPDVIRRLNRRDIASLMTYGTEDALCISSSFHSAYFSFQFLSSSFFLIFFLVYVFKTGCFVPFRPWRRVGRNLHFRISNTGLKQSYFYFFFFFSNTINTVRGIFPNARNISKRAHAKILG